jgi:hypothetical protein
VIGHNFGRDGELMGLGLTGFLWVFAVSLACVFFVWIIVAIFDAWWHE